MERQENAAKQRRMEGTIVSYGDSIQLQHTLTEKYVCVSTTDTSFTENTKLRVRDHTYTYYSAKLTETFVILSRKFYILKTMPLRWHTLMLLAVTSLFYSAHY